ncbi:MAG: hypothetical protein K6E59_01075 [Bacilli bacterium]|nr:hypothetical protein [Bacilli bacterium]
MNVDHISFHHETYRYIGEEYSTCVWIDLKDDKDIDGVLLSTVKLLLENGIRNAGENVRFQISTVLRNPNDAGLSVDLKDHPRGFDAAPLLKKGCGWVKEGKFHFSEKLKPYGECYGSAKDEIVNLMEEIIGIIDGGRYFQYSQFVDGMK